MAETDSSRIRAPRGTHNVARAFFVALNEIPAARQAEVARAAQAAIRDELKIARERAKLAASKAKATARPAGRVARAA
jgi:hypothetical protein